MADTAITQLTTGTTLHSDDWLVYVDTADTTMAATGTDKRLSPAVLTAGLLPFVASGASHAQGMVPDPGVTAGATRFLREDAAWAVPAGGAGGGSGTVTSVTFTGDGTVLSSTPSTAVTTAGTVAATLNTQAKNLLLAGPASGANAAPTFRALAAADLVGLSVPLAVVSVTSPGTAVANSAALTSLFTGAGLVGPFSNSLTVPAGLLNFAGAQIVIEELFGTWGSTATQPTILVKVLLGGIVILQSTATAVNNANVTTGGMWFAQGRITLTVQVAGGAGVGKVIGSAYRLLFQSATAGNPTIGPQLTTSGTAFAANTQVTIDTTAALALDVQVQWGTASASNTVQLLGGTVSIRGTA